MRRRVRSAITDVPSHADADGAAALRLILIGDPNMEFSAAH